MAVVPPLQFVKKGEIERSAGESVEPVDVAWVDIGKVQNAWYEDVDLDLHGARRAVKLALPP